LPSSVDARCSFSNWRTVRYAHNLSSDPL
jgi:hypothetical protein